MSPSDRSPPQSAPAIQPNERALAWAIGAGLVLPSLVTWVYFDLLHGSSAAVQQAAYSLGKALQFALPLWVAGRRWGGQLEWPAPRTCGLLSGCVFGIAVCGLLVLTYRWLIADSALEPTLLEAAREKLNSLGIARPAAFLGLGLFYSAIHSLLEEYYWRWFVYGQGRRVWGSGWARLISSLGFMAHHVLLLGFFFGFGRWQTYLFAAAIAIGGAFWAWLYQRTDNLAASWLSHALVDAGIFGLGYWLLFC